VQVVHLTHKNYFQKWCVDENAMHHISALFSFSTPGTKFFAPESKKIEAEKRVAATTGATVDRAFLGTIKLDGINWSHEVPILAGDQRNPAYRKLRVPCRTSNDMGCDYLNNLYKVW
jgi:hypothetical protein